MAHRPSGVPQLDRVLGGGIPAGDLVLVAGGAGSGKTTLALQMAFHTAARQESVCFVSTTSESPKRLLEHARSYGFYDEAQVGTRLLLLNVFPLIQEGLQPVQEALEREVGEHAARLVVLDGLMTLYDLHPEAREVRRFLFELSSMLSTRGCTLVVTSSRAKLDDPAQAVEFTMADAIVKLWQSVEGTRIHRVVQVVKARGQTPLLGLHTARVDHRGVEVFPRFESLAPPADAPIPVGRTGSSLPELDEMLCGGLPTGSVTALAGAVGTGKTLLALQFLDAAVRRGERSALVSLRETEREVLARARAFGLELEMPFQQGRLRIVHHAPVDLEVDEVMHALVTLLDHCPVQCLVLDGVTELLEPIVEEPRRRALLRVLADQLRARGITAVVPITVSQAVGPELDLERTPMAALAHNLVLLRNVEHDGRLHRILSILKVRDSDFNPSIRRYMITSNGLRLFSPSDTEAGLLTSISGLASEARVKRPAQPEGGG
jgi:circadian clock protein KaiC